MQPWVVGRDSVFRHSCLPLPGPPGCCPIHLVLLALWVFVANLGGCDLWLISHPVKVCSGLWLTCSHFSFPCCPLKSGWLFLPLRSRGAWGVWVLSIYIILSGHTARTGAGWVPGLVWGCATCRATSFQSPWGSLALPLEVTNLAFLVHVSLPGPNSEELGKGRLGPPSLFLSLSLSPSLSNSHNAPH